MYPYLFVVNRNEFTFACKDAIFFNINQSGFYINCKLIQNRVRDSIY